MVRRAVAAVLVATGLLCAACGGGPKASSADLLAIRQPTPDPTLDAVVRDLPRALAGVAPTPTPTPLVALVPAPLPKVAKPSTNAVEPTPAPPKPVATATTVPPKPTLKPATATAVKPRP